MGKGSQMATVAEDGSQPAEQSEKLKETAEKNDIPEDVLAVLQAEVLLQQENFGHDLGYL